MPGLGHLAQSRYHMPLNHFYLRDTRGIETYLTKALMVKIYSQASRSQDLDN